MKKLALVAFLTIAPVSYANAWYDAYGGFTCGYMDPLTSFFDSIFGPPCPPPVAVAVPAEPVAVAPPPPPPPPAPITITFVTPAGTVKVPEAVNVCEFVGTPPPPTAIFPPQLFKLRPSDSRNVAP